MIGGEGGERSEDREKRRDGCKKKADKEGWSKRQDCKVEDRKRKKREEMGSHYFSC